MTTKKKKKNLFDFLPVLQEQNFSECFNSEKFCSFRIELKYYKNTFNSTDC